jgi:hypothetical protein
MILRTSSREGVVSKVDLVPIMRGDFLKKPPRNRLKPSEAVAVARIIEPVMREVIEKKRRQRMLAKRRAGPKAKPGDFVGSVRDHVANYLGMGRATLRKASIVVSAAQSHPEEFAGVLAAMDRDGKIDRAYKAVVNARPDQVDRLAT